MSKYAEKLEAWAVDSTAGSTRTIVQALYRIAAGFLGQYAHAVYIQEHDTADAARRDVARLTPDQFKVYVQMSEAAGVRPHGDLQDGGMLHEEPIS